MLWFEVEMKRSLRDEGKREMITPLTSNFDNILDYLLIQKKNEGNSKIV